MDAAVVDAIDDAVAGGWKPGDPGLLALALPALDRSMRTLDPVEIPELEATGRAIVADEGVPPELTELWAEDQANAAVVLGFAALVVEELMARAAASNDTRTGPRAREGR